MTTSLVAIPYSPWSEIARWALDHHRVAHREEEYLPFVTEPLLRVRMGRWRGKVSVPVLFDDRKPIPECWDIARHAEAVGTGAPLFTDVQACREWHDRAMDAMAVGRRRTAEATLADPEAQVEALPPQIPAGLRPKATGVARWAAKQLMAKYDAPEPRVMDEALEAAREALGDGDHILDGFSYADIAVANVLQFVVPYAGGARGTAAGHRRYRKGPATRRAWTDAERARANADLLEWRDQLYAKHR